MLKIDSTQIQSEMRPVKYRIPIDKCILHSYHSTMTGGGGLSQY